jgi:hypothetical protein
MLTLNPQASNGAIILTFKFINFNYIKFKTSELTTRWVCGYSGYTRTKFQPKLPILPGLHKFLPIKGARKSLNISVNSDYFPVVLNLSGYSPFLTKVSPVQMAVSSSVEGLVE